MSSGLVDQHHGKKARAVCGRGDGSMGWALGWQGAEQEIGLANRAPAPARRAHLQANARFTGAGPDALQPADGVRHGLIHAVVKTIQLGMGLLKGINQSIVSALLHPGASGLEANVGQSIRQERCRRGRLR